ncbi:MAG: acyltransferase [Chlorobi bacterium]|nr:acyltransferase [Chlorobiota bacterium]
MPDNEFDAIRPYFGDEIPAALDRIVSHPDFQHLLNYLFPPEKHQEIINGLKKFSTIENFQHQVMRAIINSIIEKTAVSLTFSGIENISKEKGYIFLANHRDILLDSAILNLILVNNDFNTCEITWGDNLIISQFVEDIGKSNKMITVFRNGSPKEMLQNSQLLSKYIRRSVTQKNQSVWIAQRKGRSKNGTDTTDMSVLKMFILSRENSIIESLKDLNITPVTISYEWEPCDSLKVRELYISETQEYVKEENEDLQSIIGGVVSEKGRIHLHIGNQINDELDKLDTDMRVNQLMQQVAFVVDRHVHADYRLWSSNYLAYDMLTGGARFAKNYDDKTREKLNERLEKTIDLIDGDRVKITDLFLRLYANPVFNQLEIK